MEKNQFEKELKAKLLTRMTQTAYDVFIEPCKITYYLGCSDNSTARIEINSEFALTNTIIREKYGDFITELAKDMLGVDEIIFIFKTSEEDDVIIQNPRSFKNKYRDVLNYALEYIK